MLHTRYTSINNTCNNNSRNSKDNNMQGDKLYKVLLTFVLAGGMTLMVVTFYPKSHRTFYSPKESFKPNIVLNQIDEIEITSDFKKLLSHFCEDDR